MSTPFKFLLSCCLLLFAANTKAQLTAPAVQGKVTFIQVISFPDEKVNEHTYDYYFSQNEALYLRQENEDQVEGTGSKPNVSNTEAGVQMSFDYTTLHRWPVHTNLTTRQLYAEIILYANGGNREYIITEDIFPIRWKLTTEEKKIGNVVCRKATGYFRGRDYEAWYAPEIPVSLGPWKFQGLPGLILEVYDTQKNIFISAESIELPVSVSELPSTWLSEGKEVEMITLQRSVELTDQQKDEIFRSIQAKLPRGAVFEMEDKKSSSIETNYEFNNE